MFLPSRCYQARGWPYRQLAEVTRSPGQPPAPFGVHGHVHFFQRTVEPGEGVFEVGGTSASLAKIPGAELVPPRDNGGTERTIFVGALRPCKVGFPVNPECEAHVFS